MERIKVLHIITHLGVGGGLDNTLLTIKGLSRERFEVHLLAGSCESNEHYSQWVKRAESYSDKLFNLPDLKRAINLYKDFSVLRQMVKFIKSQNYQIVHTHYAKAGLLGRIAAKRAGVPVIVHTYHAFSWLVAHSFNSSGIKKYISSAKGKIYVSFERYAASLTDAAITVCELNRKEAVNRRIAAPEKIKTIYSGIDFSRFRATKNNKIELCKKFGLDPDRLIVGNVGRLSAQKSPLDFVTAAKLVLKEHSDIQFLIVGDGPLENAISEAIASEPRIKMIGFFEEIPEILAMIDIFALSSLWEGLGRALTEAMLMRLPVAVTKVGGVPELVIHKETGMISEPADPEGLAKNLSWLLNHPDEAATMGKKAQQKVLKDFSGEQMVKSIETLYNDLLLENVKEGQNIIDFSASIESDNIKPKLIQADE